MPRRLRRGGRLNEHSEQGGATVLTAGRAEPVAVDQRGSDTTSFAIHLLGAPTIVSGSSDSAQPRGRKAWGLLAFLLLSDRPVPRERFARLLFDDADDPLGTLRWNLAELRRALGPDIILGGDPLTLALPPGTYVDVLVLATGSAEEAARIPGLGQDLLAGIDVAAGAAFEAWLLAERRHVHGRSAAVLREVATNRLAGDDAGSAIRLATRLVALDEFDEEAHALLVRAYVMAGSAADARRHVEATAARFRQELGVDPSPALRRLIDTHTPPLPMGLPRALSAPAVETLIDAGEAAVGAGVVDAGLVILRRAVADARDTGDRRVEARALLALGEALVHAGWASGGEAGTALHAAVARAEELGAAAIVAEATRELGYVELKHGRYDRAATWLARAVAAAPDRSSRAAAVGVWGAVTSDEGRTQDAIEQLVEAARDARDLDKPRLEAWALTFLGRTYVLRDEWELAREALTRGIAAIDRARWMTFLPYANALLATVDLATGRTGQARAAFESAFALGCQIGDPCWEGIAARGIGLVHFAEGRVDDAVRWLKDAQSRCIRVPDAYLWVHAYCLDALCEVAIERQLGDAASWAHKLERVAAQTGMDELLVRSHLHLAALGEPGAADAARLFSERIDNPAVLRRTEALGPGPGAAGGITRCSTRCVGGSH